MLQVFPLVRAVNQENINLQVAKKNVKFVAEGNIHYITKRHVPIVQNTHLMISKD